MIKISGVEIEVVSWLSFSLVFLFSGVLLVFLSEIVADFFAAIVLCVLGGFAFAD